MITAADDRRAIVAARTFGLTLNRHPHDSDGYFTLCYCLAGNQPRVILLPETPHRDRGARNMATLRERLGQQHLPVELVEHEGRPCLVEAAADVVAEWGQDLRADLVAADFQELLRAAGAYHRGGIALRQLPQNAVRILATGKVRISRPVAAYALRGPALLEVAPDVFPWSEPPEGLRFPEELVRRDLYLLGNLGYLRATGALPFTSEGQASDRVRAVRARRGELPEAVEALRNPSPADEQLLAALAWALEPDVACRAPTIEALLEVLDGGRRPTHIGFERMLDALRGRTPRADLPRDSSRVEPPVRAEDPGESALDAPAPPPHPRAPAWSIVRALGEGTAWSVHEVVDAAGRRGALHRARPGAPTARLERAARALRLVEGVSSPALVSVLDAGMDADPPWFVTTFVDGEPVGETGHFSDRDVEAWIEVWKCIAALHALGIGGLDISPRNLIRRADGARVIVDIDTFSDARTGDAQTFGSRRLAAPEALDGCGDPRPGDVYAAGIVMVEDFAGAPLVRLPSGRFSDLARLQVEKLDGPLRLEAPSFGALTRSLARATEPRPEHRATADEMVRLLEAVRDDLRALAAPSAPIAPDLPLPRRVPVKRATERQRRARGALWVSAAMGAIAVATTLLFFLVTLVMTWR